MKPSIKNIASIFSRIADGFIFTPSVFVLVYHSVSDGLEENSLPLNAFRAQMKYLQESRMNVIDLETFKNFCEGRQKLSGKNILITFDDGYKDIYKNALPVLKKYGMPAVLFLTPGFVGQRATFASGPTNRPKELLTKDEVNQLAQNNIAIANHGWSHKVMGALSTKDQEEEYERGAEWITKNIDHNKHPDVFAFPGGKVGDGEEVLKNQGASLGFRGKNLAVTRANRKEKYSLPRITILNNWTKKDLQKVLSRTYLRLKKNRAIFLVIAALVILKIILGIALLAGFPSVGLDGNFFVKAGSDDENYIRSAQHLLSGDLYDSSIGYPAYLALIMVVMGSDELTAVAFWHTMLNLFVIIPICLVLVVSIVHKLWRSTIRSLIAGGLFILIPYAWLLVFGNLNLITTHGTVGRIGLTRTQQLFGLPLLSDWLSALFFYSGFLLFLVALRGERRNHFIFSGFLIGIATTVRLQNIIPLVAAGLVLLFLLKWKDALWFGMAGIIGFAPQLIVNTILAGNPYTFPYYTVNYNTSFTEDTYGLHNIISIPAEIYSYSPVALLLLLIFVPIVIWGALQYFKNSKKMLYIIAFLGMMSPASLFYLEATIRNPRYFLPFVPLFIIVGIATYERLFRKRFYSLFLQ